MTQRMTKQALTRKLNALVDSIVNIEWVTEGEPLSAGNETAEYSYSPYAVLTQTTPPVATITLKNDHVKNLEAIFRKAGIGYDGASATSSQTTCTVKMDQSYLKEKIDEATWLAVAWQVAALVEPLLPEGSKSQRTAASKIISRELRDQLTKISMSGPG